MWWLLACDGPAPVPTVAQVPTADTGPAPTPTADTGPEGTPTADTAVPAPPTCAPELVPAQPWVVEAQPASFELRCTTGEPRASFVATVVLGPPGAALDPSTWQLAFPTGLADAGPHDLFVSVTAPGALPENLRLTVDVTDAGPDVPGNVPPDPMVYRREFGLPVLHLDPRGPLGQEYVPTRAAFEGVAYPDVATKIRGAASADYPKPSLTIDFGDLPLEASALGLRDKHHLVLISTFDDNSYVRQKLVYDLWADLAAFRGVPRLTPDTGFVVLYLDGRWFGLYVATDHVDDEFVEERGLSRDGNLYKSVSHDANYQRVLADGRRKTDLSAGWEKKEGTPPGDFGDIEALTAWVADASVPVFEQGADQAIRVDEFMDWYLLVAFTASQDSAGKNAYLYDDPAAREFRYVPWDFNASWGQSWTTDRVPVTTFDDFVWHNGIFAHFHASPTMSATMWAGYEAAAAPGAPFDPTALSARLDAYYAAIDAEARRDWSQWRDDYRTYHLWSTRRDFTSYDGEVAYLRTWITERGPAFDAARPHP